MLFGTEGGREVVKIEGWKLWIGGLEAEERGGCAVLCYSSTQNNSGPMIGGQK